MPIFRDPTDVKVLISHMVYLVKKHMEPTGRKVDVVVGLDARGFLFGPMIAVELGCSFAPVRKKGKLPGETVSLHYELEYRADDIEIQKDAIKPGDNVLIVDDLLATGGTMECTANLVRCLRGDVVAGLVVVELDYLPGRERVEKQIPLLTVFHYQD